MRCYVYSQSYRVSLLFSCHTVYGTVTPNLLYWLPYDSFVIVEKEKGETRLNPLKHNDRLRETVAELGAGDAWYSGFLGGTP